MDVALNDPVSTITTATTSLQDNLMQVAGAGLTVGVAVFALRKGWSLLRGFVG